MSDEIMTYPWIGKARGLSDGTMAQAARRLGCEEAAIRAVFEVEAPGRGFRRDGSLLRRFEPHHVPTNLWADMGFRPRQDQAPWRAALRLKQASRDSMFEIAFAQNPGAALRATSWGLPQIMGFNAKDAGYDSARDMVEAMADSEDTQVMAFVTLILSWGLDGSIRGHDWQTFEARYNGGGFGGAYARKIEAAYRRHSGKASPQVLRLGSSGPGVRKVQAALGIEEDGRFGPETKAAVKEFQAQARLPEDGVVGRRTWEALKRARQGVASPKVQPTKTDRLLGIVQDVAGKGAPFAVGGAGVTRALDAAPEGAVNLLWYGGAGLALLVGALIVWRLYRSAA
jgi:hypothetical protein